MPILLSIAAELWAGLERDWPKLSASERGEALAYLRKGSQDPMSPALYARLLDIPAETAQEFADLEAVEGYRARMNARIGAYLGVMSDALLLDAIFNSGAVNSPDQ